MGYRDNPGNAVIKAYTELETLDKDHVRYIPAPEPFSSRHPMNQLATVANTLSYLLAEAEKAREFALSYRDFHVGAAALVLYWRQGTEYQMYIHGANMKPTKADDINIHAEHLLMRSIERYMRPDDIVSVPVLTVIGDYQHDQQSGQQTRTLHPCGVCRDDFTSFKRPSFARTVFVTARADLQTFEWFRLAQLTALHDGESQELSYAEFDHPLDIFQPESALIERGFDEFSDDERLFDAKVKFPIAFGQ